MKQAVLCLGLAADATFVHTLAAIKRHGISFDVIDLAQLAYCGDIDFDQTAPEFSRFILKAQTFRLGSYSAAYVRLLDISEAAPRRGLRNKSAGLYMAVSQLFAAVPIPTLNPPQRDNSNFSKVFHSLSLSRLTGWQIPRTCLTANPRRAEEFVASCHRGVIFKGASGVKTWATLYDPALHASRLRLLRWCPVLFQERIHGPDVRVHVVGNRVFGELIKSSDLDYRRTTSNTYEQICLPSYIVQGCTVLTEKTRVPLLGIDFKIDSGTGEWFCLEANSLPCYQGYDRRAGFAISQAITDWLVGL